MAHQIREAHRRNYGHGIPLLAASGTRVAVGASSMWKLQMLTFISENKDVYGILRAEEYSSYFQQEQKIKIVIELQNFTLMGNSKIA